MQISPRLDQGETPLHRGGYSEVWKGRHEEREVAVKVLKVSLSCNLDEVRRVSCRCGYKKSAMVS